jgi:hypothetical protein
MSLHSWLKSGGVLLAVAMTTAGGEVANAFRTSSARRSTYGLMI